MDDKITSNVPRHINVMWEAEARDGMAWGGDPAVFRTHLSQKAIDVAKRMIGYLCGLSSEISPEEKEKADEWMAMAVENEVVRNSPYYTPAHTLTAEQRGRMRGCHLTVVDGVDCYDTSDVLNPPFDID